MASIHNVCLQSGMAKTVFSLEYVPDVVSVPSSCIKSPPRTVLVEV